MSASGRFYQFADNGFLFDEFVWTTEYLRPVTDPLWLFEEGLLWWQKQTL
ncbi:MAG: hypothetical protein OES09_10940 [Gammaproteobacteria bacterium]|nr:hypothetical protein [Gammaproteobacteria bacterium]